MCDETNPDSQVDPSLPRIAIVAGEWHSAISEGLLAGAQAALEDESCRYRIFSVASSFDLPLIAQSVLERNWDAAVVLGVIIRGKSAHFERLCQVVTNGLGDVTLKIGKPIGFGILMVDTEEQGLDRAGLPQSKEDRGREAAEWALHTTRLLQEIRNDT
ncbi:6,7-dimethyl-8-ribityllumazine synthase [Paenarthrobacter sp. NPDC089989]|uniref:6,7-dimethyl-8-ribityllumazine synthase n=1 Tax=unclassified Paenarthrobacter TaxID=2634190 RepID=UPI003803ED96